MVMEGNKSSDSKVSQIVITTAHVGVVELGTY